MLKKITTYGIAIKIVDHTSASDDNSYTSNGIDKRFVLGCPIGKAVPKGGLYGDSDGLGYGRHWRRSCGSTRHYGGIGRMLSILISRWGTKCGNQGDKKKVTW